MKFVFLGIIQGLTEFLPVSSSGHLVFAQKILAIDSLQLLIIATCHMGTLFALFVFFFKDLLDLFKQPRLLGYILLVTVITGVIGILGRDFFESLFASTKAVGLSLFITGLVLIFTSRFLKGNRKSESLNKKDAIFLGLMQSFSIIPGISRSGMTISALLFRKVEKETAFRFSFLAGIPAIAAAFFLEAKDIDLSSLTEIGGLLNCFIFSFLSGLIALVILKRILIKAKFHYFGYYCILLSILSFLLIK